MSHKTNNYAKQAEYARSEFLKYDQDEIIRRFNLGHDDGVIYTDFFGDRHSISRATGVICRSDGSRAGFSATMSIYDMLCYSKPGAYLSGEWQTIANLSAHSNFGASGRDLNRESAKRYSGMAAELRRVCEELGGIPATKADVGYHFAAFDNLPVIFQFWDGDDEFEPRINFLFDSNTLSFIHFETAWYVAEYLFGLIDGRLGQIRS